MAAPLRYTADGAPLAFASEELGRRFRDAAYERHGINRSWVNGGSPRTITFLTNVNGERIANYGAVMDSLWDVARSFDMDVRPFSVTAGALARRRVMGRGKRTDRKNGCSGPLMACV
jgi:hypothetical protein